jgi:hypothetical protein
VFYAKNRQGYDATFVHLGTYSANDPDVFNKLSHLPGGLSVRGDIIARARWQAGQLPRGQTAYVEDPDSGITLAVHNGQIYPILEYDDSNEKHKALINWSNVQLANRRQLPFLPQQQAQPQQAGWWGNNPAMAFMYGSMLGGGGMNPYMMMGMNPYMMGMNPYMMGMNPYMMGMNPFMMGYPGMGMY